jgi:hypothetical protein
MAFLANDQAKPAEPVLVDRTKYDILSSIDYSSLSIHELLSQPVPVLTGVFTPPDAGVLAFNSHDRILVESPFHLEKLRGYHGLRASVTLRLVVNADKYTQGTVCVSFLPATIETTERRSDHRHVTQLTHVELDFNTDTEVSLTIPHRGPYTHFDLIERRYNTGIFLITTTLAHRGNPVPYTVYMSYSDVDLQAPTSTFQVTYEAGDQFKSSRKKKISFHEEEKAEHPGSWSKALAKVSSVMTTASAVPILTPLTEPLAWASGVASGVASVFGWSRPIRDTTPIVYVQRDVAKLTHVDGEEYAEPLAQTTLAQVRATDQIGLTSQDETSFAYLCGIKSQIFRFAYGVSTPTGTKLFTLPLDPGHMFADSGFPAAVSGNQQSAVIAHPMFYIANLFGYYRGSLGVCVKLSKTIFHSGRLMVVFEPFYTDTGGMNLPFPQPRVNTIADAINCHKDIVDIRSGDEFSFSFPYTSPTPYKPVGLPYGYMHVFVLNQLVRNDTAVSDQIDVGIRVHACEDIEFAVPTDPVYWPLRVSGTDDSEPFGGDARTLDTVLYESGLEVRDTTLVEKPIGSSMTPSATVSMAELAIGEKLLSLKQVAMKSKIVEKFGGTKLAQRDPFVVDQFYASSIGEAGFKQWFDFYSYVGSLYLYGRGGVILTIHKDGGVPMAITHTMFPDPSSLVPRAPFGEYRNMLLLKNGAGADRVYIPPYDCSFVRYNHSTPGTIAPGLVPAVFKQAGFSQTFLQLHTLVNSGLEVSNQEYQIYRAAAEDTQFGCFIGVPYLIQREPYFSNSPQHYRSQLPPLANS